MPADEERIVAQFFDPDLELVVCVVCHARVPRHTAHRVQIDRWIETPVNHEIRWEPTPRADGWSETFNYYYPQAVYAAYVVGPHFFQTMSYRYTYTGYGCMRGHAEDALHLHPWRKT